MHDEMMIGEMRLSERIDRIKQRLFNEDFLVKKDWWGDGETILTSDGVREKPLIIRKALAIRHVADNMPTVINEDELIAGRPTMSSVGFGKCFPQYTLPDEDEAALMNGFTVKSVFGHHLINYETLLEKGVKGVREDILLRIAECAGEQGESGESNKPGKANESGKPDASGEPGESNKPGNMDITQKTDLYEAMLISIDALSALGRRYSLLLAEEAAQTDDPVRRGELEGMAAVCLRVPENPAGSFHEALQSVFFAHVLLHSTLEMMPLGRVDKYLFPYYKKDMDAGVITKEGAEDLVGSWLAKFSERVNLAPDLWEQHQTDNDTQFNGIAEGYKNTLDNYDQGEEFNFGTSGNHFFINMILGGQFADGSDSTNELTGIILRQWASLELVCPVMSVRFHEGTPDWLYRQCADILRKGSGEPAIYNDEIIIHGLTEMGIPLEEARGYSNDGCWEAIIPGRTDFGFCMLQLLQLMEYLLQGGRSLIREKQEWAGIAAVPDFPDYESFYGAFLDLLAENARKEAETRVRLHGFRSDIAPSTLASAFMDDCVQRGAEYSKGGACYSVFGMMLCGFANCVDSLAVIKKLVYEEKALTLPGLAEALRDDFRNLEPLRRRCIAGVPKFGNDDDYVDEIAVRLMDDFSSIIESLQAEYAGGLIFGKAIATFEFFAKWGRDVGASADGRFSGAPVATNLTPGTEASLGPTAIIRSATKARMHRYGLGAPIDIKINKNETAGESGLLRLVGLIRSFLDLGGIMLTITGVSDEELRDAQINPMNHKNLRVRLGGLSAYFIALSREVQDSIIGRTSHEV